LISSSLELDEEDEEEEDKEEEDLGEKGLVPLVVVLPVAPECLPKVLLLAGTELGALLAGVVLVRVTGVALALLVVVVALVGALGDEMADLSTLST